MIVYNLHLVTAGLNHPKLILVLLYLSKTLVTKVAEANHLRSLVWLEMVNHLVFVGIVVVKGTLEGLS